MKNRLGMLLLRTVALLAFVGACSSNSLSIDKTTVKPGEQIKVTFKASGDFASNAWVGIIPSNIAHGSENTNDQHDLTYQYLRKRTSGTLTFKAPTKPGKYDVRMHDTDSDGKEVTYISFEVQ